MHSSLNSQNIKLIISDFDGVFTDGMLEVFSDGRTSKKISYRDIMAISIILKKGINFVILSGEKSFAIDILKEKFPQIETFQNERNKLNILNSLIEKYEIKKEEILYVGDDINDIDCLNMVGYPYTTADGHEKVKKLKHVNITNAKGGHGVLREIADLIL